MKGKAWDSPRGPGDTAGTAVVGKHPMSEGWVLRTPACRVLTEPETVPFQAGTEKGQRDAPALPGTVLERRFKIPSA